MELTSDPKTIIRLRSITKIERSGISALKIRSAVITYHSIDKNLILDLPVATNVKLQLFRPSDAYIDREITVNVLDSNLLLISLNILNQGYGKSNEVDWRRKELLRREKNLHYNALTAFSLGFLGSFHCVQCCALLPCSGSEGKEKSYAHQIKILYNLAEASPCAHLSDVGSLVFALASQGINKLFNWMGLLIWFSLKLPKNFSNFRIIPFSSISYSIKESLGKFLKSRRKAAFCLQD